MITREQISDSVYSIQKKNLEWTDCNAKPIKVLKPINISPKQLKHAQSKYLFGCSDDTIVILVDNTLLGSGKSGYVFSTDAFYCNELAALKNKFPYPLKYNNIKRIEKGHSNSHLLLVMNNGAELEVFFSIYTNYIFIALNRILELQKNSESPQQETNKEQTETISNPSDSLKLEAICQFLIVLNQVSKNLENYDIYTKYRTLTPLNDISAKSKH